MSPLTVMLMSKTRLLLKGVGMNPAQQFVALRPSAAGVPGRGWNTLTVAQFHRLASPSVPAPQPLP